MKDVKRTVSLIAALDIAFIGLLFMSSLISGIVSDILYYTAFAAPILFGIWSVRYRGGIEKGAGATELLSFTSPLVFPTVGAVCAVSLLVSLLLRQFGFENEPVFDIAFWEAAVLHAFIPAVLEEILFRFIPITLLKKDGASPGFILIFTSLAFSFAHTDLFSIPYAFIAGAVFAFLFMATGSILPSLAVHLINNIISLLTIYYDFDFWIYIALAILSLISVIIVFLRRKAYISKIKELFSQKTDFCITAPFTAFIAICSVMSILTLSAR